MHSTGEQLAIVDHAVRNATPGRRVALPIALGVALAGAICTAALIVLHHLGGPIHTLPAIASATLTICACLAAMISARQDTHRSHQLALSKIKELRESLQSMRNQAARLARERDELRVEAEAATLAKGEFLATISHEIRTPLNGIIPLLEMLQASDLESEQAEYLGTAYQSSRHLLAIIDNILDYSKIDSGKLELEQVGVQVDELINSVAHLMSRAAERRGVRLETRVDRDVRRTYRGDPVRLRQVVTNLVSNAVKFTHEGRVKITVSKRSETSDTTELLFSVRDTGIGIPPAAQAEIFEPFSQADASTTRNYGGTGLGLAICKRLVAMMDGDIGVKSEVGRGTVFWFTARLLKASGDVRGVRDTLVGARALVASADPMIRARVERQLGDLGLEASTADSIRDALHQLRSAVAMGSRWALEALIIDYESFGDKARNLTRAVRNDPQLRSARLVALLGEGGNVGLAPNEEIVTSERRGDAHRLQHALEQAFELRDTTPPERGDPDQLRFLDPDKRPATPPPPTRKARKAAASPKRTDESPAALSGEVLLVEDNPVNLAVAKKIVGQLGLSISVARNGQEAVDLVAAQRFDAVLMDCQMPVMDGYAATGEIRGLEASEGRRIPIIAMTANAMSGDRQKCLDAGMDDYLSKPLKPQLIESTLRKWLQADAPGDAKITNQGVDPMNEVTAPVIDETVLSELMDIMGAEISDLVQAYLEDAPKLIGAMRTAADHEDVQGLIAPAHTLKSTSANLGALALSEMAKTVEHRARAGAIEGPQKRVSGIEQHFALVRQELTRLL